jgi:hypothetical protein
MRKRKNWKTSSKKQNELKKQNRRNKTRKPTQQSAAAGEPTAG